MKKIILCLSILFLVCFLPSLSFPKPVELEAGVKEVQIEKTEFDYSRYFPSAVWRAIQESQGTLYVMTPTFGQSEHANSQALVIDAEEGLILSVGHAVSKYPAVAFGESTMYFFIFKDNILPAKLDYLYKAKDLAVFQIDKNKKPSDLKSVVFVETPEHFTAHYAFKQDWTAMFPLGFSRTQELSFKANIVGRRIWPQPGFECFSLDNAAEDGFSGAGLFNKRGEAAGMLIGTSNVGNYSIAISAEEILKFIKEYREYKKTKEEQGQKQQEE